MSDLNNLAGLDQQATTGQVAEIEKKQHVQDIKAAMQRTIQENGQDIVKSFGVNAGNIVVKKVLCYSDKGNIVEVQAAQGQKYLTEEVPGKNGGTITRRKKGPDGNPIKNPDYVPHKVATAPKNVGFVIANTGKAAINFVTSKCVKDENGGYTVQKVQATLKPGAEASIRKGDFTALLSAPEFSFQASNGTLVPRAGSAAQDIDILARLENYTFKFNDGNIADKQTQIGEKGADGKWHVRAEFVELFGDEENVKTSTRGTGAPKGEKIAASAFEANYIRQLLSDAGYGA